MEGNFSVLLGFYLICCAQFSIYFWFPQSAGNNQGDVYHPFFLGGPVTGYVVFDRIEQNLFRKIILLFLLGVGLKLLVRFR